MTKTRTDKSKWPSRYSPNHWVTSAQYIIEYICEKRAAKDNTELPVKFWELPEWADYYKSQLRAVHRLLKIYDEMAIIKVVQTVNVWSIYPKWIEGLIKREQALLDKEKSKIILESQQKNPVETGIIVTRGKRERKPIQNSRSKLLALDDED